MERCRPRPSRRAWACRPFSPKLATPIQLSIAPGQRRLSAARLPDPPSGGDEKPRTGQQLAWVRRRGSSASGDTGLEGTGLTGDDDRLARQLKPGDLHRLTAAELNIGPGLLTRMRTACCSASLLRSLRPLALLRRQPVQRIVLQQQAWST